MFDETQLLQGTGLPPVLPSLAKPRTQPSGPPGMGAPPPVTALPPVTTLDPSPEQQRVTAIRSKLQNDQNNPSFTKGLWDRASQYHAEHPGVIGRLGQVGAGLLRGVDIAGETFAPKLAVNIPGSIANRSATVAKDKADLAAAEGQSTQAAMAEKDRADAYKARVDAQPRPNLPEYEPTSFETPTGGAGVLQKKGPEAGQVFPVPGFEVKPPNTPAGQVPLSTQDAARQNQIVNGSIAAANKKLPADKQIPLNPYLAGMSQEQAKFVEGSINAAIGKEQGQVHIDVSQQSLQDREEKDAQAQATQATQGRMNLYAQQNYAVEMRNWLGKTKTDPTRYAKDVALMTTVIKGGDDHNLTSGVLGSTPIGVLLGGNPIATIAGGAGLNILANAVNGPANAILDSLQKQGISPEGYQAMQAYFNALPARMAFEISSQGLKASSMRFGALINKIMNTIPPPNTPRDQFPGAFQKYFTPMKVTLESGEKMLRVPQDYQYPTYEQFYPESR